MDDFIPREAMGMTEGSLPITYKRWRSLVRRREGAWPTLLDLDESEDFLSSDLPDEFLRDVVFKAVDRPLQFLLAQSDHCYIRGLDVEAWAARLQSALPEAARTASSAVIEGADHGFSTAETQQRMYVKVGEFLQAL